MPKIKHGDYGKELYKKWSSMKNRCNDKNSKRYGKVGVSYSSDFENYEDFREWALESGYIEGVGLELDKDIKSAELGINPPIYSPDTCMFVTRSENCIRRKRKVGKSGFIGVVYRNDRKKYLAKLSINGKVKQIASSKSALECAEIRDKFINDNNLTHIKNF